MGLLNNWCFGGSENMLIHFEIRCLEYCEKVSCIDRDLIFNQSGRSAGHSLSNGTDCQNISALAFTAQ